MTSSPPPNLISVKSMISIFENQSYVVNNEPTRLKQRTKSVENVSVNGNIDSTSHRKHQERNVPEKNANISTSFRKYQERNVPEKNLELAHIEQQIQHLQRSLNNYKSYSRDNHIYYQNQIFFLLTDLVNIETKNKPHIVDQKTEMIELLKRLNKGLITRLPSSNKRSKSELPPTKITKPVEEKPKEKLKEKPPKIEHQETIEMDAIDHEIETPALSVKSLKKLFEKEDQTPIDVPKTKLTRAFMSFNGTDTKYIPFSQRFKSKEAESAQSVNFTSFSTNNLAINNDEVYESSVMLQTTSIDQQDKEQNDDNINGSPKSTSSDSSSSEESDESSNEDSDDEANEGNEENEQNEKDS